VRTPDPTRFSPYREPLRVTLARTVLIALLLGTAAFLLNLPRFQASTAHAYRWLTLVTCVHWVSFGGHWVEIAYLNLLRPRIARWPDTWLVLVRLGVWVAGGTLLMLGLVTTYSLMARGDFPRESELRFTLRYGGLLFAAIELVPHTILALLGRPSFWNLRG
jgi:hypothetical protein